MATSPNFSWPEPDNTDLVKNGALAIRTAVDAIDSSLVDLKGGTTGQVLSKASNTDMDFTWTTASAGSTNMAGKNTCLNSNMSIWSRGTSFASSGTYFYTADRWGVDGGTTGRTISRQATSDTTNLPFIQYCVRVQRNLADVATTRIRILQPYESVNTIPMAGKTITVSWYARAGANYSAASGALGITLYAGTGTDENPRTGSYTGQTLPINTSVTLTTTWQRFTQTVALAATVTEITPMLYADWVGVAGAADYFEFTGFQIEIAASASAYSPNAATIQGELAACQRYYIRLNAGNTGIASTFGMGYAGSTTSARIFVPLPVPMRRTGSNYLTLDYSSVRMQDDNTSYTVGTLSLPNYQNGGNGQIVLATSTGMTQYRPMELDTTNGGYVGFSAEL
jgi:hypothetical protein